MVSLLLQPAPGGSGLIIQLETAVGAAMKNFDRAIGMCRHSLVGYYLQLLLFTLCISINKLMAVEQACACPTLTMFFLF